MRRSLQQKVPSSVVGVSEPVADAACVCRLFEVASRVEPVTASQSGWNRSAILAQVSAFVFVKIFSDHPQGKVEDFCRYISQ